MILVKTAMEVSWNKTDEDILFLGEWCKLYNRKDELCQFKSKILDYHWNNRDKFRSDFYEINKIYETTLKKLAIKLNELHNLNYDDRSWKIILGPWLHYFISMLFDRWEMLQKAIIGFPNLKTYIKEIDFRDVTPIDMNNFHYLFMNDEWNHYIYSEIIKETPGFIILNINKSTPISPTIYDKSTSLKLLKSVYRLLKKCNDYIYGIIARKDYLFEISSYWTRSNSKKINKLLNQTSKKWTHVSIPVVKFDRSKRNWKLNTNSESTNFEKFLLKIIPNQIPVIYLEGLLSLQSKVNKLPWPKNPKFIYTANSYSSDEVFKLWSVNKISNGAKLIIGQHGGHYGIGELNATEEHEISISDFYLTWGWKSKSCYKTIPMGIQLKNDISHKKNSKGLALVILVSGPRYSYRLFSIHQGGQWVSYFSDIEKFHENINDNIKRQLLYKKYPFERGWFPELRLKSKFADIQFCNNVSISEMYKKSRIVISTYNGTTYLESISNNFPTLIFWDIEFSEIRFEVKEIFEELRSVKIFHTDPKDAAIHLNNIWENIDEWWYSEQVQKIVSKFRDSFCLVNDNYVRDFTQLIKSIEA